MDSPRFKLVLPAALFVSTILSVGACKDDPEDGDSESSDDSSPSYCADIETMDVCDSEPGCGWDPQLEECSNTCFMISDEVECRSIDRCQWNPLGGSETGEGGAGACEEPFT